MGTGASAGSQQLRLAPGIGAKFDDGATNSLILLDLIGPGNEGLNCVPDSARAIAFHFGSAANQFGSDE